MRTSVGEETSDCRSFGGSKKSASATRTLIFSVPTDRFGRITISAASTVKNRIGRTQSMMTITFDARPHILNLERLAELGDDCCLHGGFDLVGSGLGLAIARGQRDIVFLASTRDVRTSS